jgi:hypothetical protein
VGGGRSRPLGWVRRPPPPPPPEMMEESEVLHDEFVLGGGYGLL